MSLLSLAVIGTAVFVASLISGVFGIAGGMIMLGVLLVFFDVSTAMVLFSLLAATGNAWRVMSWWRHVDWRILRGYAVGGSIATVLMWFVAFVPSKAMVYLILGLIPYVIELLPRERHPNIEWRGVPLFSGLVTTAIQLVAGNGGLFLDVFFQKSTLDRKTTVATKAICGTVGNLARMVYFGTIAGIDDTFPLWAFIPAALLAIAGTMLAPYLLERMSDQDFRRWTRQLIFVVSAIYLARAAWLFWQGTT
jgi:uncharacterized membrane protein YfcA